MTTTMDTLSVRIDLFDQAAAYAVGVLTSVRTVDLDRATPCESWDVRAVVLHLADVADAVIDLTATGDLSMPPPRPRTTQAPVAVARERIDALREVLTAGNGSVAPELLMGAAQGGANELAAHAWDISAGLGLDRVIPDGTATGLLAIIEGGLDDAARGANFAPPVPVPVTASPSDAFVAYLGRHPALARTGGCGG